MAGGLFGHVLVGGRFQKAGVGVLLHQCAGLGLGLVEAGGGSPREVLAGDLPGFMVDIHLPGCLTLDKLLKDPVGFGGQLGFRGTVASAEI